MAIEVKIPIPDQTTEEVRIVGWIKAVGQEVKKGDIVLEIETDKAVMEVEAVGDGVLLRQLVGVDDIVPVGQVIGYIGEAGEDVGVGEAVVSEPKQAAETVSSDCIEVKIPIPDQTTEEVRIVSWIKAEGQEVKKGDIVLEIETDKAVMEVEAVGDGVLLRQLVETDDMVPTGQVIGYIGEAGTKIEISETKTVQKGETVETKQAEIIEPIVEAQSRAVDGRIPASPNAKRLAKKLGVNIGEIEGSGAGGRIVGKDVESYSAAKPAGLSATPAAGQPSPGTEVELTKMRRAIGINLQNSFRDTPHFNVTMSIDMAKAMKFREQLNQGREKSGKVSVNDLVVKACALALKQYSAVNSRLLEDRIKYLEDVNVGVATAVEAGLVVPVVLNTDKLGWYELAAEAKRVVGQARGGKLIGLGKGTFTVSNLGMFGVEEFTAIINPPECAILAIGGICDQVVAVDGMIAIRPMMKVTLCSDHRLVDGALAAQFLQCVKLYLEEGIS